MSRVEIESFIKSFLLFFISLASITALRYYEMYENKIYLFEERLFSQMKISSFNKEPTNFIVTNVPESSDKISNVFSFNKNQIFVLFEMKDLNNSLVKVSYPLNSFLQDRSIILEQVKNMFYQSILIMFIISILFSLYALHPLKKSLSLTNEFIKVLELIPFGISILFISSFIPSKIITSFESIVCFSSVFRHLSSKSKKLTKNI